MRARALAICVAMSLATASQGQVLRFDDLQGWQDDDHQQALRVFQNTCDQLNGPDWQPICKFAADAAKTPKQAKAFFEMMFRPTLIGTPPALFTGYFEPELPGSLKRTDKFKYPVYGVPKDLVEGAPYLDRKTIEQGALAGKGLEIAWLADPVDVFFLHIQGSGRIDLPDGRVLRLGYAARNGFEYKSLGQALIARGVMTEDQVSAAAIRAYVKNNGAKGKDLLNINPSYVFFREIRDLPKDAGPIGAMSAPITTLRSIAVDPAFVQLGAPVWLEKNGDAPINRLMIAQDTGGAIKGAQRADIFFGTGPKAGDLAGNIRDGGRMVQLLPIDRAYTLMPGG